MCQVIWHRLYSQAAANTRLVGLEVAGLVEVDAALIKPYKVLSYQWLCHLVIWFSIVSILRIKAKWPRIFYCVDLKKTQSIILTFNIRTDRRTDMRCSCFYYIHIYWLYWLLRLWNLTRPRSTSSATVWGLTLPGMLERGSQVRRLRGIIIILDMKHFRPWQDLRSGSRRASVPGT